MPSEVIVIILSYCNSLRRENSLSFHLAVVKTNFPSTPFLSSIKHTVINLISLFWGERERESCYISQTNLKLKGLKDLFASDS